MNGKKLLATMGLGAALVTGAYYFMPTKTTNSVLDDNNPIPLVSTSYTEPASTGPASFEKAATTAVPSVVHIKTTIKASRVADRSGGDGGQSPFGDFFGNDEMLRQFFGGGGQRQYQQPEQKASGSGVVISSDGYIVTNNHVVDGATDVTVTLNEGHKAYKAKVVGTDPNTDLALIKIEATNLPVMPVGNSDDVKLGQWVLAVGYPLNLDVTVTQGIVSAKSRNIGINRQGSAPVEAFIQTDAAVNPGSSGGALINTNGELIGINAAIASPTGSYAGYAYSIPSNLMRKVIGDIMKYGSVQRGYLGISMAPDELDDATKKELGISNEVNGVYVRELDANGAAAKAGVKKGDAIIKVNDAAVSSSAQLSEQVARLKPGDKVNLTLQRGNELKTVSATLQGKLGTFASQQKAEINALGASFATVSKEDAAKLGIAGGVQVTDISNGIIGNQTNMKPGFVITKVNGQSVRTTDELTQLLNSIKGNFQLEGKYPGDTEIYYYGINGYGK